MSAGNREGEDRKRGRRLAGVNMHLAPGGIRELHWYQTAEWAIMTRGKCRVTTIDFQGRPSVDDVEEGDLWYFPAGLSHSLQGLGPIGAEFVLAFDDGRQSESNTLLLTDWFAHTPPDVLASFACELVVLWIRATQDRCVLRCYSLGKVQA